MPAKKDTSASKKEGKAAPKIEKASEGEVGCLRSLVSNVVDASTSHVDSFNKAADYAVLHAVEAMLSHLALNLTRHDPGERLFGVVGDEAQHLKTGVHEKGYYVSDDLLSQLEEDKERWRPDTEPAPVVIDSFARSRVEVRKRIKLDSSKKRREILAAQHFEVVDGRRQKLSRAVGTVGKFKIALSHATMLELGGDIDSAEDGTAMKNNARLRRPLSATPSTKEAGSAWQRSRRPMSALGRVLAEEGGSTRERGLSAPSSPSRMEQSAISSARSSVRSSMRSSRTPSTPSSLLYPAALRKIVDRIPAVSRRVDDRRQALETCFFYYRKASIPKRKVAASPQRSSPGAVKTSSHSTAAAIPREGINMLLRELHIIRDDSSLKSATKGRPTTAPLRPNSAWSAASKGKAKGEAGGRTSLPPIGGKQTRFEDDDRSLSVMEDNDDDSIAWVEFEPSLSCIQPPVGMKIPPSMRVPSGSLTLADVKNILRVLDEGGGSGKAAAGSSPSPSPSLFKDGLPWKTFVHFFAAVLCVLVERICKASVWSSMAESIVETVLAKLEKVAQRLNM
uniref:Uncharacterized protein n=1 Tax=Palpitomonas bilix TaxID=652834 RepID=A0A7S3GJ58_9EUKA|mmetsp:Transcript_5721/g.13396  ORF Transcript_5721/g.13396 Transcript_5721/m.13396 type:complete len:564 (+) Transcript_5721:129-1820(+)